MLHAVIDLSMPKAYCESLARGVATVNGTYQFQGGTVLGSALIIPIFVCACPELHKHFLLTPFPSFFHPFPLQIKTYYLPPNLPQLDLILLGKANYFVGNCISSFTAFVKRERDVKKKPSDFFGLSDIKNNYIPRERKTEL